MKNDTEIKIQEILDEMQQMFKVAIGPRNRREYMNSIGVSGRDWHFGLTAEQIIVNWPKTEEYSRLLFVLPDLMIGWPPNRTAQKQSAMVINLMRLK